LLAGCDGGEKSEVLKNAGRLNAEERQALTKYFRVEPGPANLPECNTRIPDAVQ